jgi:methanogenic corrinoid protein MtbC1
MDGRRVPVTKSYAEAIGADGCGETAAASVELAGCLAGEKQEGS